DSANKAVAQADIRAVKSQAAVTYLMKDGETPKGALFYKGDVDKDGNIVDLEKLNGDDSNLKMLGTVLKSGTMIEFFDTGKVKLSVISADYSFSDDKNISIKSSLIKTPLNLKVNIENNAMTLNSEQGFTVNLKK
ncbi:MAG: hypothetical protein RSA27_06420, partial [Oscillospiraceae bacterium]